MAKQKLDAAFVKTIKVGAGTDYPAHTDFWDQSTHGFGLRVTESGVKSWSVFYNHHGQPRKLKVGSYPTLSLADARKAAIAILRDAELGLDPATARKVARIEAAKPAGMTFGDLTAKFLDARKGKRSLKTDERIINKELAVWKNRPVKEVNRQDVDAVVSGVVKRGKPVMANLSLIHI